MAAPAKVFAQRVSYIRTAPGVFTFTVEYKLVSGADSGGRMQCSVGVENEAQLSGDIKDALITHLETHYPGERFRRHQIVGL